jgi:hypothetical protein
LQDEAVGISSGFEFDAVLGTRCGQQEVFDTCGKPVLEAALQGRRSSLLTYGESGAGKTYSLFGGADGGRSAGVVPQLAKASDLLGLGGKVSVTASYFELVAGVEHQVFDLLDAGAASTSGRCPTNPNPNPYRNPDPDPDSNPNPNQVAATVRRRCPSSLAARASSLRDSRACW